MSNKITALIVVLMATQLLACSEVDFSKGNDSGNSSLNASANANGNADDGVDGDLRLGGTASDPKSPQSIAPSLLPKVRFVGPPCLPKSMCAIRFELNRPADGTFEFDWRTNDTAYQQAPPPGQPIFGQPNVHYVPTAGHVRFIPGESSKTVYVQNINPYGMEILIRVRMSVCQWDGHLSNCTDFFE